MLHLLLQYNLLDMLELSLQDLELFLLEFPACNKKTHCTVKPSQDQVNKQYSHKQNP